MNVQKYLKEHGLEKLVEEFKIKVTDYPDRVSLNYSQIESPKFHPIADECRGLILKKDENWTVLARSFQRFYNFGEGMQEKSGLLYRVASDVEEFRQFNFKDSLIEEKRDGCCDQFTKLTTKNGERTIRDICESRDKTEVLAYDFGSNEIIWTNILGFSIKENNDDWFEILADDGKVIRLTSNHYVWLPEQKRYRSVKDLKEGDEIFIAN